LYITKSEFDSLNADPFSGIVGGITGLKILKNEDPCGSAIVSSTIPVNTTYAETHGAKGYMLQGNIHDFSSFYFASVNITLPLNLLTFKGSLQNNNTTLKEVQMVKTFNRSAQQQQKAAVLKIITHLLMTMLCTSHLQCYTIG
jgi:hypothetical protein